MNLDHIIAVRRNKTIYREGNLCIKAFDSGYSKADILNEALNQARVEESAINVPKLREVSIIDGRWCIVSDFIVGKTLGQLMEESPDRFDEYLDEFVNLQLQVHAQTCPMLRRLREKMNWKIAQTGLSATTRYELHTRLAGMPTHNKLCHGDFNLRNIIITDEGEAYILDWAHATQGNASADAALTYLIFRLNGDRETAEKYLTLFCRKSDIAKQYVQKWLPIVAACQRVKASPEERDFLSQWVSTLKHE